ncbi:Crp/Fnr family transcriptional regulator [Paenibacillus athensensis]|uniref:Crp/Fnr family transcriptional regulator n=1 Tax=Paenibacillus athensensis TaxID=1967502 RepID=A0A4Y8Q2J0_9BACL|nr:Crp/Fnr family transcriptional regulator [Paenibacillus athensensis]MCD1258725.1 Crp/Fnr family transcriptional regulator [Paenibacillus athensensis]
MKTIVQLLQNVPIFQVLPEEDLFAIAPLFTEKKVKKNSILFLEGDPGEEFYLIKSGVVKIYRLDDAKEIILALFREGDFFGEMSLIHEGLTRSATAETMEMCVLYSLKRSSFVQYMEKSPKLCLKLLESTMQRLRKANEQIYDLTFLGVRSRILKSIIRLSEQYGVPSKNGLLIDVKLTHQQLANIVGTVRESVTKVLQELQDEGSIVIDKKKITLIDTDAIKKEIR